MSTPATQTILSPHIREELVLMLGGDVIEFLAEDIENIAFNGYIGLNQMTDYDLIELYERVYGVEVLDTSSVDPFSQVGSSKTNFTSKLMLDIATNRMLHAES